MRALQSYSLKPRISKSRNLWVCESAGSLPGFGSTPKDAYDHWKRIQMEAMKRLQDLMFDPMGGYLPPPKFPFNNDLLKIQTIS